MNEVGIALLALGIGAAVGAVLAVRARRGAVGPGGARVEGWLEAQAAEIRRLADATRARDGAEERLRADLEVARRAVDALRIQEEQRTLREREHAEVIRRLAGVLAGAGSKGKGGENVLRERLADLPPGLLVTDFRVNGKVVEYGLLLPDGRRLPIDSKWPAVRELEALEATTDPTQREVLARDVERIVTGRVREVCAYLDPAVTSPVAVAAIPDAAYAVLRRAHADAFSRGVVIVPYSTALPVVLFLFSVVARFGAAGDVQGCLAEFAGVLDSLEGVLENRFARAATMVANGVDEVRSQLGKARGSIARARASRGETLTLPLDVEGGDAPALVPVGD